MKGADFSELDELAADLSKAGIRVALRTPAVVRGVAQRVQQTAREFAPGAHGGTAKHYPQSITIDVTIGAGSVTAEIGPDKNLPQGALGNIFEYGTSRHAPHAHLGPALDRESPHFARLIADLGGATLGFR